MRFTVGNKPLHPLPVPPQARARERYPVVRCPFTALFLSSQHTSLINRHCARCDFPPLTKNTMQNLPTPPDDDALAEEEGRGGEVSEGRAELVILHICPNLRRNDNNLIKNSLVPESFISYCLA